MFSRSKDKIDELYPSLQEYLNIKDDRELKKYIVMEVYRCPYVSIHLSQPYLTQRIPNMISSMEKFSATPNPTVKPPPEK